MNSLSVLPSDDLTIEEQGFSAALNTNTKNKKSSSMLQAFVYDDFYGDKRPEILCAGNFYPYKVEQGRSDSFFGGLLECSAKGINEKKLKAHYG